MLIRVFLICEMRECLGDPGLAKLVYFALVYLFFLNIRNICNVCNVPRFLYFISIQTVCLIFQNS